MNLEKYLTVGALTKYLKFKFDSDDNLKKVYLKGEISNFKPHSSGHYYFSIKDDISKINAIMFSTKAQSLNFVPSDGIKVLVTGRISIYEATGNYQIYVDEMIEDGLGNLYIAFEQLKEKLSKEGLFDPKYKKPIPKIPNRIGIITAPTGAAIKDILSTIKRRFPICETILFPSLVQGENAALDIVKNIKLAENYNLDVLIVGRGGGSIEDLWPFNEEMVARAIFDCSIPVISAVGHEIDYTISDFVADLRAPTPTGAAEIAVPNMIDLKRHIEQLNIRLTESIYKKVNFQKLYLDSIKNSFIIKNPMIMYENKKQYLDNILEKINNIINGKIEIQKIQLNNLKNSNTLLNPHLLYKNNITKLNHIIEKLQLVNPLETLKRGYTLTYMDNSIVTDINKIKINDKLTIKFHNGLVKANVEEIKEEKNEI